MEKNILSPEQLNSLRGLQYNTIYRVEDASLNEANHKFDKILYRIKPDNDILQTNVNQLKSVLDANLKKPEKEDPEYVESIKWNHYFYKKYTYQIRILVILLGVCALMNILFSVLSPETFSAVAGVILAVVFIYVGYLLWDLLVRDNVVFDEYNYFNYTGKIETSSSSTDDSLNVDISNCLIRNMEASYKKL